MLLVLTGVAQPVMTRRRHPYVKHWKHETFGKRAVAGVAAGAAVQHVRHHPGKYGRGVTGFGKRVGAGFATHAVTTTVEHAIAAPLHEDLHYHRSTKRGFGPRMRHALVSTVVTRNTKTGKHTAAAGRISGHAAAGAFTQAALHTAGGASTAGIGLAADAGVNVAREFWPRHKRHHSRRRYSRHRA